MVWDIEKIKSILPHREPFLFIDEIIEIRDTQTVIASKIFSEDEYFFTGHFPNNPIVPGAIIIEAMAQTSIFIYYLNKPSIAKTNPNYYLGKVKADFYSPVLPNDKLIIEAQLVKVIETAGIVDVHCTVNNSLVSKSSIVFGVKQRD